MTSLAATLLLFLGFSLGCSDALRVTARSDACGVSLRLPFGMNETDDLLTGSPGIIQASGTRERYLTVQCVEYATYENPWSALTALDTFTSEETWEPRSGDIHSAGVHLRQVGGHTALGRYTWEVLDNGVRVVNWSGVIDLPDRRLFIEAWTLADTATELDDLLTAVDALVVDAPGRPQLGRAYTGVTPITPFTQPLDRAREGIALELVSSQSFEAEDPPEGWEVTSFPGPLGAYNAWVYPGTGPVLMLLVHPDGAADRSAAWREAGGTVVVPFVRGVNGSPGQVERLWGEVDDVLAARAWLGSQPAYREAPVVLAGGWAEGTLAALAATRSADFAKVVVLASPVDVADLHARYPRGYEPTEYAVSEDAHRLRSPLWFTPHLRSPVLYVSAEQAFPTVGPYRMERTALEHGSPFELVEASQSTTVDLFEPVLAAVHARAQSSTLLLPLTDEERLALALSALEQAEGRVELELRESLSAALSTGFVDRETLKDLAMEQGFDSLAGRGEVLGAALADSLYAERVAEAGAWPRPTDPERLDRAFEALESQGIVALHHFEDCNDCAFARARHEVEAREERGLVVDGFVYYSRANTADAVDGNGLYLGYGGWRAPIEDVGQRISAALAAEGLDVRWSGDSADRIQVTLDYKRRPPP